MKKYVKLLAMALILVLLCGTLTGCIALDQARQTQAFYTPERDILWNGSTYRLLPPCDELRPEYKNKIDLIHVTEPDVPVLLKDLFGMGATVAQDGLFLSGYGGWYCRADRYEEIAARITAGFTPTGYCFAYYYYDEKLQEVVDDYYRLKPDQSVAVEQILATVTPNVLPANTSVYFDESIALELCTDDLLFRRDVAELCADGDQYYLRKYSDKGQTILYAVPQDMCSLFDGLLDVYSARYGK